MTMFEILTGSFVGSSLVGLFVQLPISAYRYYREFGDLKVWK